MDFHPQTRSHERIVKMYQPENSVQEPSAMDLLKQHFNLMNPYGAKLAKLKEKISALMNDPTVSDQQKVIQHVEMMNESRMLKEKYRDSEGGLGIAATNIGQIVPDSSQLLTTAKTVGSTV